MAASDSLREHGFRHVANLRWTSTAAAKTFAFDEVDSGAWVTKSIIYVYVDTPGDRVLYVVHTGQSFRARFNDYARWLNGLRKNDSDTPIRFKWLACLETCMPAKVGVWIKPSSSNRMEREVEERRWMETLKPVLNSR